MELFITLDGIKNILKHTSHWEKHSETILHYLNNIEHPRNNFVKVEFIDQLSFQYAIKNSISYHFTILNSIC